MAEKETDEFMDDEGVDIGDQLKAIDRLKVHEEQGDDYVGEDG